jgi:septal ring factor EnvC (AmiA/AmiB activator)
VKLGSALAIGVLSAATLFAGQPSSAPRQAPDRLTALQREADALARQEKTLLTELRQLEVERDLQADRVRRAEAELSAVTSQRADAVERIAALEARIATETPGLSARLVDLYKLGRPGYLRLLFDVDGVQAAARGYRTVTALVAADRRRVDEFQQALDELRGTERLLADRSARMQALQAQAEAARQAASRAVARHTALIAQIDARRDLNAQMLGELEAARNRLAALAPGSTRTPAVEPTPIVPLAQLRGSLEWPAGGTVAGRFGPQRDQRFGTTTMRAGIEIAAIAGVPATAIESGEVVYAEPFGGFGNLVILDHGHQDYSLYGYLDSVLVTRGMRVARGQAVGSVGHAPTGKAGLYFELRIDGKAVDPVQWLKKKRGS